MECPLVTLGRLWTRPPTYGHLVIAKYQVGLHGWRFRPDADLRVLMVAAISGHDVPPHPHSRLS
jgi:hypothetical protein